jgi:hypothetical protein
MSVDLQKYALSHLPHITQAWNDLLQRQNPVLVWVIWYYCEEKDGGSHDIYDRPPEGLDIFLRLANPQIKIAKEKQTPEDAGYLRCDFWCKDNVCHTPELISDTRDSLAIHTWFNRQNDIIRNKIAFVSFDSITRERDNPWKWRTVTLVTESTTHLPADLRKFLQLHCQHTIYVFSRGSKNVLLFSGKHMTSADSISMLDSYESIEKWFKRHNDANRERILRDLQRQTKEET